MSQCPYCGDTRLSFNPRPTGHFDEGELFHCCGCGGEGEGVNLIKRDWRVLCHNPFSGITTVISPGPFTEAEADATATRLTRLGLLEFEIEQIPDA